MTMRGTAVLGASAALLVAACSTTPASTSVPSSRPSSSLAVACPGGTLKGEGASSQKTVMEEVIKGYTMLCPGSTVEYTSSGSGAGIKAFHGAAVDWAGSDSALRLKEKDGVVEADRARQRCGGNEAWNLPLVFGPIAVGYHLDGVDRLNLTAETLAGIFDGAITRWNAPEIAASNPGVALPDERIAVFYRADESGTTENFSKYLAEASDGAWPHEPSKAWAGVTGEGREKTAGVAEAVVNTPNSISYMEWGGALERDIPVAAINGVELTASNAGLAIEAAEHQGEGHDLRLAVDHTPDNGGYGAIMATYEVVCSAGGSNSALLKDFLGYFASPEVQASLEDLGYAPLPDSLQQRVAGAVSELE